jgi:hypothetical protein
VTRGASPLAGLAGIDSAATVTPQQALALQRTAGNAGTARLLAQRGHRRDVAGAGVVQRMPWPDPAAAHQNLLDQGWRVGPDGGYTRAPVPESGEQEQAAGEDDALTLRVLVRKNASFRDPDYLQGVGHSWVAFYKDDKFQSSAGFYPMDGQINEKAPYLSVPGEVRLNHDDRADATTELSVPLTRDQFSKAQKYIQDNLNRRYNLLRFNCTDFVIGVHKAATGHSPPGRNLLVPNNPNDLHSGIKKHKKSRK